MDTSKVVQTYSDNADTYDSSANERSCWGLDTERIANQLEPKPEHKTVVDVGTGGGGVLHFIAHKKGNPGTSYIGVEPAANLRKRAEELTAGDANIDIREGAFERLPLEDSSVDYFYSINSFHWCPDPVAGVRELKRTLKPNGQMDHFFIGRNIGREFVRATSPIFLRYMGPKALLEAATMRSQMTVEDAQALFEKEFGDRVTVSEEYTTYYDTVEGHMGWWVRIAPQLLAIPENKRAQCEADVNAALQALASDKGVPYTMHTLRAKVR